MTDKERDQGPGQLKRTAKQRGKKRPLKGQRQKPGNGHEKSKAAKEQKAMKKIKAA